MLCIEHSSLRLDPGQCITAVNESNRVVPVACSELYWRSTVAVSSVHACILDSNAYILWIKHSASTLPGPECRVLIHCMSWGNTSVCESSTVAWQSILNTVHHMRQYTCGLYMYIEPPWRCTVAASSLQQCMHHMNQSQWPGSRLRSMFDSIQFTDSLQWAKWTVIWSSKQSPR